ncbi:MAG: hypothetical protein Q4G17_05345, partial [Staphylococcus xylosus]|nr:hypothetical protein [Staphylococcus xylosus]
SKKYHIFIVVIMVVAYGLSFVGFAGLINFLYPIMGIVGLVVVIGVLIKYYSRKRQNKKFIA